MDPIMEPRDIGQAYDIGLADGVIVVDSVADEYIRLQDECARLRCLIEQSGAQEWSRRVRAVEDESDAERRAKRAEARAVKAETDLLDTVALAQTYGWNGVENSKILWIFFRDLISGLETQRDEFAAALEVRPCPTCGGLGEYTYHHHDLEGNYLGPEQVQCDCGNIAEHSAAILARVKREAQEKQVTHDVDLIKGQMEEWRASGKFRDMGNQICAMLTESFDCENETEEEAAALRRGEDK